MNRVYKVIYNRARNLYQVVSEIVHSRGKTKSLTAQHQHERLTTAILIALFAMGTSLPVGWAADTNDTPTATPDTTTVGDAKVDASNLSDENKTAWRNALGVGTITSGTYTTDDTTVAGNLSKLDTQVKKNAADLSTLSNTVSTNNTDLNTKITSITSDITRLEDLSNIKDAGKKVITGLSTKITQGDRVTVTPASDATTGQMTYTISVNNDGKIESGNTNLVSGGTMYTELRPTSGKYISAGQSTAANLISLDQNLLNVVNALGLDADDTTKSYTSKLNKYFKVNPKSTTTDGTTDAAANGTNSVAIGPSAQAGEKTTDTTTSVTTVTGGTSSTAIGDSAKANGDQSVALGYGSEVLNASGSTKAVSGSTAIGSGAKVEGGSDSTALGSGATVDTASNAMALGKNATINKTATSGVAIGNGAVTGSADKTITVNNLSYAVKAAGGVDSVAIGTDASSAGSTSIALGKGATVENDSDGSYQAVVKSDDIAVGTGAKTTASDASTAIGKGAFVSQSTDALAIGSRAAVGASSNDAMALGKGATVGSGATDSIAVGTSAKTISADTIAIGQNASATGANSVVIGKGATTTSEGGNAIGLSSTASGNSTAIGQSATANNYNAVAIGNGATANADKSIALGYNAGVGTSEGKGETQNAGSLIAIGTSAGNNVLGMQNVAIGESAGSNVKSSFNVAIGSQAGYGINYASDNKSQNGYNVSIGYKANYQENSADIMYSTALGNEANASNYAVAIGDEAKASGTNSLALGYSAKASDAESMALGHNASAADGNVAIGNGSLAPAVSSLGTVQDGYVYQSTTSTDSTGATTTTLTELKSAFTYKPLASDSHYISVGTSTLTRRISNVADGVFASDAATVGQLNSLNELLQATDTKVGLTKDYFERKFTDLNTTIDASKTHYFSISESSDNLSANKDNTGATSNKADAMAIGPNANATNVKSLAVGNNVYATGLRSIAIGTAPNPTKDAAGTTTTHNTSAEGENSIALGTSTTAQADNSVAIGTRAQAYTTDTDSGKTGARSVAIGNLATTAGDESVALGYQATVKYNYGTAIGKESLASGVDAVAIGKGSKAYSKDSMAIGQDNSIIGDNVYGLGSINNFSGDWGAIIQSGVSGYNNTVTSVSDQDTTNALTGIYMTGNTNDLNQQNKYNVMQDITVQGTNNKIYGGSNISAGHPNTLSQIAIVGSGNNVQGKSDDDGRTNNIENVTILGYNNKVDANTDTTVDFSNTQILGNNVTATLGNSVYLGNNAAYVQPTSPASDAITAARTAADTAAEASDEYKAAATDEAKVQIKAEYEAKYLYKLRVQAMEGNGTTAGMNSYDTDETYGNGTSYTYAGSNPTGVITVGSVGSERRIQNVAAGLVSATSTDAVNGSQLYALTRQIRFGGDNSNFGKTTAADDQNVVARGSNETISITGGSDAVKSSTADGTTTYTVDAAKLTGNNIAVVADKDANALHVQLASNLKDLNTAQLGSGNGESYKETIKLDGTGTSGGQMTLASADGTVKTTLDTTGITIANGPKFTSSSIDAANQQIHNVTAGTKDADAVNVKQLQSARTLLTQGTNTTLADTDADGHHTYTVNVDNLAVKANGTGTTTVELAKGINFKDGTNTTAAVGADGTVTISATHNKLSTVSAAPTGTNDDVTLTLTDTDGNTVTSTGLKNTYTTVTKDSTAHTVTFARNDGTTQTLSLGDLDGASTEALNKAAAKATSEVTNGTNVASVTTSTGNNGQNIYTVNVDDLAVKTTSGEKKSVHLADGLVFADGTNTTATVGDNGTIKFNVSNDAIKKQAVQAVNVTGGSNVTVTPEMNTDGTLKTFTVAAPDLKYSANGTSKTTSLANGISFAAGANTTAEIDNNGAIKINATHNKLNATGTATKATADNNSVTLTLNDQDGNTTTTALTDTYTTVSKDATSKKVTFKRNDGETQTLDLNDLGGITEAQDKYVKSGTVTYNDKGEGTASLTGNNGLTASITGLKDTKISSGTTTYVGTQGNASGSATLTMNDGSTATITGLQNDYITSAAVGTETNHVTMTRLGGGTVDLNLNPILEKYSLSDYHLVGAGTTHDQAYAVDSNGTVTLNVVDDKNPTGTPKTIQITGLASQSGVNAGRTTVKSSDSSVIVDDGTSNSDTHTYDIKVDYSKIPANLTVKYSGDNGTSGSNTMDKTTAFSGTANQIVTKAEAGKVTFKLADDISGIQSVTTGEAKLDTNGLTVTDGPSVLKTGINAGGKTVSNVGDAAQDTDAATLGQVKKARTKVAAGSNVAGVDSLEDTATHQTTYTVNVNNLSVKANNEAAKSVTLKNGLTFNNGTNTTASVGDNGEVKYDLNSTLTGLISVTAGNSTLDNNGLTIKEGSAAKVAITSGNVTMGGNVIHNVGDGVAPTDAVNKGQLEALQTQVSGGWNLAGKNSDGTAVTAKIGAGKTVTYTDGTYTKSVVTKDDNNNATVKVDVTAGTFGSGTGDMAGTVTSTANGLATTQDVANAINSAYWTIQDGNNPGNAQQVKAGDTVSLKAGDNLSLDQNGREFTYKLNKTLQNMTSVTAVDDKQNTAVLNSEGLKVSDKDGNSLTQHATEIRLHDATKAATDTTTDVVLNKQGLQNGGHTITGVAKGTVDADSQDAINGSQLYELQQKVTNGWKITGDDTTKASNIGNDKTVSFVNGDNSYIKAKVDTTNTGATVSYTAQTASLMKNADGKAALNGTTDGLVTGTNLTNVLNSLSWTAQSSKTGTGQNNGSTTAQSITAGTNVGFIAGDNMILTQNSTNFTYALNSNLTGMNTIAFTGLGNGASNLTIGLQNGGGANPDKGYYITGLSNTKWDQSNYEGTRAATEAQLREAIDKVSAATGTGGFGLTADEGANNGGEKKVSQTLGRTIAIQGDGTYGADGTVVKQGNISTVAYTDNAGPTGAIKVKLNKDIDLSEAGSLTIGASKVSAGSIVLDNTGDAAKKIALNSTAGTASIGGVTVNGAAKTVMGLANTTWDGTAVSGRAATEDQLAKAISDVSEQATNSELHIRKGTYSVGKDKAGQDVADSKGKNSVSIDVVNAKGTVDGQVVINDVAKASELGTVGDLADNLKNPAGGSTTVVQAVNKVNQKIDESLTKVNGDISNAVTEARKHTEVKSVDSDNNVTIDGTTTNAAGGTVYKLGLNKEHLNLGNVHIDGNKGRVTAKTVEAEMVKIDDQTRLDKKGLTTGNTTVADGRVVVGGDNGIKIETKGDQQTISGLSNRIWTGKAVNGRAATEDQLQQAVENATATAAQNEQHIQSGNYDVGQGKGLDGKLIGKNSVAINVVSGDGTKPGDVKGQVVINNVAKADELGNVAKLNDTVKNADGRPTSTVDAINNLDKRVETKVGDNVYSNVAGKEIADGDSATTAIGKLNNRMNDIYTTAGQHSSVSTADTNLTLSESKNASGGTDYKIGLNKEQINLGNLTIKGNEGSIEAKSIKSDSFTAGDTVVNKDGIKVGDQSALTGDSLKVNGKTYVDDKGVDANGQVIRNVGDGKDDGDAVNVKQVNDLAARQGEAIGQNAAHINQLDRAVNRLDSRINRVGAGAAALAALHPGNYDPDDKVDFAAGFGNYRGASAAAVGMYYHPDETTTMSVGASFGGGENMVNAGITWKMGKNSGHMRTQAATKAVPVQFVAAPTQTTQPTGQTEGTKTPQPVTTVTTTASGHQVPIMAAYLPSVDNSTRAENDELKELLARQTAILEKLAEQKTAAAPAAAAAPVSGEDLFPDVPENHWAYDFVAKLAKAGALKDCRVEAPANNPMLTRNDFAQILYTALKNGATKNPALNKDNGLNRLASEFRTELKNVKR